MHEGEHSKENNFYNVFQWNCPGITSTQPPQFCKMNLSTSLTNFTVLLPQLRVFDIRVLRRIFGPNRDKVTGEWRKLHNKELTDLYCSQNIIWLIKSRKMRWAGHVARMGERRSAHRVLVVNLDGKIPLGRPRRRSEDNFNNIYI